MQKRTLHANPSASEFGIELQKAPKKTPPPYSAAPPPPRPSSAPPPYSKAAPPPAPASGGFGKPESCLLQPVFIPYRKSNNKAQKGSPENPLRISLKPEAAAQGYHSRHYGTNVKGGIEYELPPWPKNNQLFVLDRNGKKVYFLFTLDDSRGGGFGCAGCSMFLLMIILGIIGIILPPLYAVLLIAGVLFLILSAAGSSSAAKKYEKDAEFYHQQHPS